MGLINLNWVCCHSQAQQLSKNPPQLHNASEEGCAVSRGCCSAQTEVAAPGSARILCWAAEPKVMSLKL